MNFFSKIFNYQGEKNERLIALDIGTEVVKALVFYVNKKKKEVVIEGVGREYHKNQDMRGGVILNVENVILTCRKAIDKAIKMAGKSSKKVIVGASGGLAEVKIETVYYERENPSKKIDLSELTHIICYSQKKIFSELKEKLAQKSEMGEIELIDVDVVDFCIDGYRIASPLNFKGHKIKISISNFYVSASHLEVVRKIVGKLGLDLMELVCEPQAVSKIISMQDFSLSDKILIDIGGGITNISLVHNKNIENTKTFLMGGRSFTDEISQKLELNFSQAEDLKIKYSKNKLGDGANDNVRKILDSYFKMWLLGVDLSLKELSSNELLPSQILIYGGGSQLLQFSKILNEFSWTTNLPFAKKPKIIYVSKNYLSNVTDKTNALVIYQDLVSIGLSAYVLDLEKKKDIQNKILRKIINKNKLFSNEDCL